MEKLMNFGTKILMVSSLILILLVSGGNTTTSKYGKRSHFHRPKHCLGSTSTKEKISKFRFYVQDLVAGDNRTVWEVSRTGLTDVLPSGFGLVSVLDNLVTSGPEMDSEEVGRIQGIIGLSDFHEKAIVMLLNLVFSGGEYKGSSLCILGRNPLKDKIREVPIVSGTGVFRMARGYAITTTYSSDEDKGVIEYNVVVAHMDFGDGDNDCVSDF